MNSDWYTHDSDRAALNALKAIPGFTPLMKAFMSVWNEKQFRIINMSSNLRLGEQQLPKYYNMLPPICEKLGIPVPDLFLELNVVPNAYTYGDTNPFIVITSGLLDTMPEELIPTVLAHECGHIACHHTLYRTMGQLLLNGAAALLPGIAGLLSMPLQVAFYYWMRCSEYSADRAAAICDGSVNKMINVCMRFAGLDKSIHDEAHVSLFLQQAQEYKQMIQDSAWNKTLEFMMLSHADHPFNAVRAYECYEWGKSDRFQQLITGAYTGEPLPAAPVFSTPAPTTVRMPYDIQTLYTKQADDAVILLQGMGFRNVSTCETREHGLLTRPGQTTRITIDGSPDIKKDSEQPVNALVVVYFYQPETPVPDLSSLFFGKKG